MLDSVFAIKLWQVGLGWINALIANVSSANPLALKLTGLLLADWLGGVVVG